MFGRRFCIQTDGSDLTDRAKLVSYVTKKLAKEINKKKWKPYKFRLLGDPVEDSDTIMFYDCDTDSKAVELSAILGEMPPLSIICDGKGQIDICDVAEDGEVSTGRVSFSVGADGSISAKKDSSKGEASKLRAFVLSMEEVREAAQGTSGQVRAGTVTEASTGERRAFFTLNVDVPHGVGRKAFRNSQSVLFGWSEDESVMIFICKTMNLPPEILYFPLVGGKTMKAMQFYLKEKKAVALIRYSDGEADSFEIVEDKPIFEDD